MGAMTGPGASGYDGAKWVMWRQTESWAVELKEHNIRVNGLCMGATDTPMGALRARNGHPEPFGVRYWEVGNEIYGRWQVGHTTPAGNVDRFLRFSRAMRDADPSIRLLACGCRRRWWPAAWRKTRIFSNAMLRWW